MNDTLSGAVKSVTVSPNSKDIASGSYDKTVRLWRTASAECLHVLTGNRTLWSRFHEWEREGPRNCFLLHRFPKHHSPAHCFPFSLSLTNTHARTYARTHTHIYACTCAHMPTRTHMHHTHSVSYRPYSKMKPSVWQAIIAWYFEKYMAQAFNKIHLCEFPFHWALCMSIGNCLHKGTVRVLVSVYPRAQ